VELTEEQQNIIETIKKHDKVAVAALAGGGKTQMLIDVFTKVESSFSKFSSEIDLLKTFFNGNDKRITGGHKVVLKLERSKDYPEYREHRLCRC